MHRMQTKASTEEYENWIICVQNRRKWKEVVEKAKPFCD
jgi:hypothetical protein